jgi:hypothetical protein
MTRSISRTLTSAGAAAALALLAACQGSSTGNATMSVHLVDGPSGTFTQVNLHVVKVEISKDGTGWITLGTPNVTVDLLSLTGGVAETLVDGASIPAGTYGQMRLVLGDGNTVCTEPLVEGACPAAALHDLKVPSGMQSGVKLDVHFDVQPDTTKDVFVDFDAHRSVFVHQAGSSGQYILRPVVRAFDRVVTGAVTGVLTDAATKAPLAGAEVMAETLDASGNPSVARTAKTAADGSYVLDLLPVGGTYWVVAQPRVGTMAYDPGAAGPFGVTADAPVAASKDLAFNADAATGALSGAIAPVADATQTDEVTLLGTVPVASVNHTFVLRSEPATVSTSATPPTETWGIDLLPAGSYGLYVTRATETTGGFTFATGPTAPASVTSGTTTKVPALTAP